MQRLIHNTYCQWCWTILGPRSGSETFYPPRRDWCRRTRSLQSVVNLLSFTLKKLVAREALVTHEFWYVDEPAVRHVSSMGERIGSLRYVGVRWLYTLRVICMPLNNYKHIKLPSDLPKRPWMSWMCEHQWPSCDPSTSQSQSAWWKTWSADRSTRHSRCSLIKDCSSQESFNYPGPG